MKKAIIEFGKAYGNFTIIKEAKHVKPRTHVYARCICGNIVVKPLSVVVRNLHKSCGCIEQTKRANELIGRIFGEATVIKPVGVKNRENYFECLCSCGKLFVAKRGTLVGGHVSSCGHLVGLSNIKDGGRGTTVCERWLGEDGFKNFILDLGVRPSKIHQVNRIDNNGNYDPSNCEWVTPKENAQNRCTTPKSKNLELHQYYREYVSNILHNCLRNGFNSPLFEKYYGISFTEFKHYIESKFLPGMTWMNNGQNRVNKLFWQFDHIKPLNSFDLSKESEQLKAFHYTNIQPLWWEDNQRKRAKDSIIYA